MNHKELWEITISKATPWQREKTNMKSDSVGETWSKTLEIYLSIFPRLTVAPRFGISLHVAASYSRQPSSLTFVLQERNWTGSQNCFPKRSKSIGWSYFLLRSTTWFIFFLLLFYLRRAIAGFFGSRQACCLRSTSLWSFIMGKLNCSPCQDATVCNQPLVFSQQLDAPVANCCRLLWDQSLIYLLWETCRLSGQSDSGGTISEIWVSCSFSVVQGSWVHVVFKNVFSQHTIALRLGRIFKVWMGLCL